MSDELKQCPFCGNKKPFATSYIHSHQFACSVVCGKDNCGSSGTWYSRESKESAENAAYKAWNTRAEPPASSSGEIEDAFGVICNVMDGPIIDAVETIRAHIAAIEADNKRLREALQFYADSSNYETRWTHSMFECQDCGSGAIIDDDCGEIAKAALSQADGKAGE